MLFALQNFISVCYASPRIIERNRKSLRMMMFIMGRWQVLMRRFLSAVPKREVSR